VDNVTKHYPIRGLVPFHHAGVVHAVDGVTLHVVSGETVSIVGESGCGKTTIARLILRQTLPTSGRVLVNDRDIGRMAGKSLREYRSSVQAVLQDPWASLNPRHRVRLAVGEPLIINQGLHGRQLSARVDDLLKAVGLDHAVADSYPHELSGGMRQRVAIARALSLRPALVVLDEPVSALDVSIRAQVINLLKDLQVEFSLSYLMISHNLTTVRYLSQRVLVMYLGEIVESAATDELFAAPLHPYTQALLSAASVRQASVGSPDRLVLKGSVPSAASPPTGCRFHTRCPFAFDRCRSEVPAQTLVSSNGSEHMVACHLYG
jgi:oligopeptide/dipeptide ABC transporter ATP-binding protein